MLILNVIDESRPYCVYHHIIDGNLFYVGSGVLGRAFEHGSARRNEAWNEYAQRSGHPTVSVFLAHRCEGRSEARRVEYEHIHRYRPIANLPRAPHVALDWQIKTIEGVSVATDAYTGWDIEMLPDGDTFVNLKMASLLTGISESAISNSITGRYPVVSGKTFRRIPAPERRFLRNWDDSA